ncbi:hypothetical protein AB0I98_31275 [Streptomyces sp. NPDC050211]|uniref:hypothetical protein n=1 Tax=Streptomyces sp. NPDC050211 TaxID=3154932 RepID=UPI003437AC89
MASNSRDLERQATRLAPLALDSEPDNFRTFFTCPTGTDPGAFRLVHQDGV